MGIFTENRYVYFHWSLTYHVFAFARNISKSRKGVQKLRFHFRRATDENIPKRALLHLLKSNYTSHSQQPN